MINGMGHDFIDQVNDFVKALPLHLDPSDRDKNTNGGFINFTEAYDLLPKYNQVYCDIVCETVHNGQTFAFTEKNCEMLDDKDPILGFWS